MSNKTDSQALKGSQKWIQKLINNSSSLLDSRIVETFNLKENDTIEWLFPLEKVQYREYKDQAFLNLLNINLDTVTLKKFWPRGGPFWDGLGKFQCGNIFLVEAKSHISEIISNASGASDKSLELIIASLKKTKDFLKSKKELEWSKTFYQYTNRIAHLYLW